MNLISDINIYNSRMANSAEDKLFWLKNIETGEFASPAAVVDFGCADGSLTVKIADALGNRTTVIGYDNSGEMITDAKAKNPRKNVVYTMSLPEVVKICSNLNGPVYLNMSSVMHELFFYLSYAELVELTDIINNTLAPDMIFIRDFQYSLPEEVPCRIIAEETDRVTDYILSSQYKDLFADYANHYDTTQYRNIVHFLLKYSYRENWARERDENYFWDLSFALSMFNRYSVYSSYRYVLPYTRERIRKDFYTELLCTTHCRTVLRRCR